MRLFLVRHGETESNRLGLALGRNDVPLNERGALQAEQLAVALGREPLVAVYASPLRRTLETARAVAGARGLQVAIEERLIEMDIGELDGLTFAEVRERYPGLLEEWVSGPGPSMLMPGGERLVDVQERAWAAVTEMAARHPEDAVAAVSHNFVILSLLTKVLGVELSQFRRLRHAVAAVSVVDFTPKRTLVVRMNDTCHLEGG